MGYKTVHEQALEEENEALRRVLAQLQEKISKQNKKIVELKRLAWDLKDQLGECRKL